MNRAGSAPKEVAPQLAANNGIGKDAPKAAESGGGKAADKAAESGGGKAAITGFWRHNTTDWTKWTDELNELTTGIARTMRVHGITMPESAWSG